MTKSSPASTRKHLEQAQERAHIIRAIHAALSRWDEVSALVFSAESTHTMRRELEALLDLDEAQAMAVMDMQVRRVAAVERGKIEENLRELEQEISEMKELLDRQAQ